MRSNDSHDTILAALPTFPHDAPLAWAAVCGAVSAVGLRWDWTSFGRLLAAVALVEFVSRWAAWLVSLADSRLPQLSGDASGGAILPYTVPDSPAHRLLGSASRALRRVRMLWSLPRGLWARTLALLLLTGLLLSWGLGGPGMWAGISILAAAIACGIWLRSSPPSVEIWGSALLTTLAWAVGALAVGGWRFELAVAAAFGLVLGGLAALQGGGGWGKWMIWAGLLAPAVLLAAYRLLMPAAAALVLAAPAFVLSPRAGDSPATFAAAVRRLLWVLMALTALSMGWT